MQEFCSEWSAALWNDLNSVAWLEWAKAFFDLLKGISWPVAIFSLVYLFRVQIRERIKDLISAGPTGAVFQPSQSVQPPQKSALETSDHPMATVKRLVEVIGNELNEYQDSLREPKLIKALAEARTQAAFEGIFGVIFASQVNALRLLTLKGAPVEDARSYYETEVRPTNKEIYSIWDFEGWANFLFAQQLVKSENGVISITDIGKDFLYFIDTQKVGMQRPS